MGKIIKHNKILIAEDERPIAEAIKSKLIDSGFEVVIAIDGEQAVEIAGRGECRAVILDLVLPKLDGFEVLKHIKELPEPPLVIIIANIAEEQDRIKAFSLGAAEYFVKSSTTIDMIADYLNK